MRAGFILLIVLAASAPAACGAGPDKEKKTRTALIVDPGADEPAPEARGSFCLMHALMAMSDAKLAVTVSKEPAEDLSRFDSVFLVNVPELSDADVRALERYLTRGGGVAFFLGPNVSARSYNDKLYKKGKGILAVHDQRGPCLERLADQHHLSHRRL